MVASQNPHQQFVEITSATHCAPRPSPTPACHSFFHHGLGAIHISSNVKPLSRLGSTAQLSDSLLRIHARRGLRRILDNGMSADEMKMSRTAEGCHERGYFRLEGWRWRFREKHASSTRPIWTNAPKLEYPGELHAKTPVPRSRITPRPWTMRLDSLRNRT